MNRLILIAALLVTLFLFTAPATAGFEPSPFGPELGVHRLNYIEGYALTAAQMVTASLGCPPDDIIPGTEPVLSCPPDDQKSINALKRLSRQLNQLKALVNFTAKDLAKFGTPPDDTQPPEPCINELDAIAAHALSIKERIEPYLSTPPDDVKPELLDALGMLLESAKVLYDSALEAIALLSDSTAG